MAQLAYVLTNHFTPSFVSDEALQQLGKLHIHEGIEFVAQLRAFGTNQVLMEQTEEELAATYEGSERNGVAMFLQRVAINGWALVSVSPVYAGGFARMEAVGLMYTFELSQWSISKDEYDV